MHKLDWYIFKKFLFTFFFCLLLFTAIAVAVDTSEKTDDFVKSGLTTYQIIHQYYFGFVPFIWSLLFPLFVFIAVIFFTSRMAARSEIIAVLASGTSYDRLLRPYLLAGFSLHLHYGWETAIGFPRQIFCEATSKAILLIRMIPRRTGLTDPVIIVFTCAQIQTRLSGSMIMIRPQKPHGDFFSTREK